MKKILLSIFRKVFRLQCLLIHKLGVPQFVCASVKGQTTVIYADNPNFQLEVKLPPRLPNNKNLTLDSGKDAEIARLRGALRDIQDECGREGVSAFQSLVDVVVIASKALEPSGGGDE